MALMKSVRVPERAYGIMLWVLSVVFAAFIIGLGNLIIGDLPQVEETVRQEQFVETVKSAELRKELSEISARRGAIDDRLEIARLLLDQARRSSQTATETFQAWIQTRTATTSPQQDPDVIARTRQLEQLKANERTIQASIDQLDSERLPLGQRESALMERQSRMQAASQPAYERALFWQEMRIFLLRLAVTLPMLLIAAWLVVKKRKSDHWPLCAASCWPPSSSSSSNWCPICQATVAISAMASASS